MGISTIYEPKGKAKEYGDLALNIYTGCPHRCTYCYVPAILRRDKEVFHSCVEPRKNIVEETKKVLGKGFITVVDKTKDEQGKEITVKRIIELKNKLIHLCFTCDPYPNGKDTTVTRQIIEAIKNSGNHVQILTKGDEIAMRDFDLLNSNDWFGVSHTGATRKHEPNTGAGDYGKDTMLRCAKELGINTWVSCEPVINAQRIYDIIARCNVIDLYRIGKLNYALSDINWGKFGRECERLCILHNRKYMIKESLRAEMNK